MMRLSGFLFFLINSFITLMSALLLKMKFDFSVLVWEWQIMSLFSHMISFTLVIDSTSLVFLLTVLLISTAVFSFSGYYMEGEKFFSRFHWILLIFVLSMMMLILSPNLISLMLGWDGLGVSSFLLVIFYSSKKAYGAGFLTALSNRVGDALILISIGVLFSLPAFSFMDLHLIWNSNLSEFLIIMTIALFTKSAQIPFSAWLPAAMAAPTPVSALVHSSTLVTAGVYLLIRLNQFLLLEYSACQLIFGIGSVTMFMASLAAFFETDMKKMIALSTLSQLGVMMVSVGLGETLLAFFHLLTHAFFKATLFMASGSLIHNSSNYQDLRLMGMKFSALPFTSSVILICSFSLCGIPFMSAFFSKDAILEMSLMGNFSLGVTLLFLTGIGMTFFYSARLFFFSGISFSNQLPLTLMTEKNKFLNLAFTILLFMASLGGSVLSWFLELNLTLILNSEEMKIFPLCIMASFTMVFLFYLKSKSNLQAKWAWGNLWSLPILATRSVVSNFNLQGSYSRSSDQSWVNLLFLLFKLSSPNPLMLMNSNKFFMFFPVIILVFITVLLVYLCNLN